MGELDFEIERKLCSAMRKIPIWKTRMVLSPVITFCEKSLNLTRRDLCCLVLLFLTEDSVNASTLPCSRLHATATEALKRRLQGKPL